MDLGKTFVLVAAIYLIGGVMAGTTITSSIRTRPMALGTVLWLTALNALGIFAVLWVSVALSFTNR